MEKRLNRFGLSSPTRLELMMVLLLALFVPFYFLGHNTGVLGESTTGRGPTPTPPLSVCKNATVEKFTTTIPCGNDKYRQVNSVCGNGSIFSQGNGTSCKPITSWLALSKAYCKKQGSCNITRKPTPTKKPKLSITPTRTATQSATPTTTPTPTRTPTPTPSL